MPIEAHHVICEAIAECERRDLIADPSNVAAILAQWLAKEWTKKPGYQRGIQPENVRIDARPKIAPIDDPSTDH